MKYRSRKGSEVDAVQVAKVDLEALARLYGGKVHEWATGGSRKRGVAFTKKIGRAAVGDYIIFSRTKNQGWKIREIAPKKAFERRYTAVPQESPDG